VKYLIMLYSNQALRDYWMSIPEDQRTAGGHHELIQKLNETGELVVSEALPGPDAGKRVSVKDGQVTAVSATDGPYAEVKEFLAGFYLIDCENEERAIEYAAMLPEAQWGMVEVRPILDLSAIGL
jgi:hypothetical protein